MIGPEVLRIPALAVYTELRDKGEVLTPEKFQEDFPGEDYEHVLEELRNAGYEPEPTASHKQTPRGVIFNRKSSYALRIE